jgi:hypothetical protein
MPLLYMLLLLLMCASTTTASPTMPRLPNFRRANGD